MMTIGETIRQLRKAQGKTLAEVADAVTGYDAGNLSRFEQNKQDIATDKLHQLAKVLGTTVAQLYIKAEALALPGAYLTRENANNNEATDVAQYNIKDFTKYTDKLNTKQLAQFEELLSYFVVVSEKHQQKILDLAADFYESDTKINSIARRRAPPKGLIEDNKNGPSQTGIAKLQK